MINKSHKMNQTEVELDLFIDQALSYTLSNEYQRQTLDVSLEINLSPSNSSYEALILKATILNLQNKHVESKLVIDNISASGDFHQTVNLVKLQQMINAGEYPNITTHFDRNFFPGAFCKIVGLGTVTVFQSGKFVIVGSKCQEHVDQVTKLMSAIINELSTMNGSSKYSRDSRG